MIFSHFPISTLIAYLKQYDVLILTGCKSKENIIRFREECINEIERKHVTET